jgi:hypothetical protein
MSMLNENSAERFRTILYFHGTQIPCRVSALQPGSKTFLSVPVSALRYRVMRPIVPIKSVLNVLISRESTPITQFSPSL